MAAVDSATVLRTHGQRATPARCAVLDVIAASDAHLSADQIADRSPDVHRATVFRTLDRLVAVGVLAHVHVPHAPTTYHVRDAAQRMHLHVVCRSCGEVFDAPPTLLDGAVASMVDATGFTIDPDHTALSGTCVTCLPPR